VLFIALEFAPIQQTGAFRAIKFVKYLRELGVEPVVVTIEPEEAARNFGSPVNPRLLEDLPQGTQILHLNERAQIRRNGRVAEALRLLTSTSDGYYRRYRDAMQAAANKARLLGTFDAVYASLPPFGAGWLALDAARILEAPLVIDMRDAWSQFGNGPFPSYLHYLACLREERQVLKSASRILTVTRELGDLFCATHPDLDRGKVRIIPNGFDGAVLGQIQMPSDHDLSKPTFDIAYVGSYYYDPRYGTWLAWYRRPVHRWLQYKCRNDSWLHRSPEFFFRAWAELCRTRPEIGARVRFHHIGKPPGWLVPMIESHGLREQCVVHGVIPNEQLPLLLQSMDAFLSTSTKPEHGPDYCLASKTFDYIASGKPIVGFVVEGAQKEFLERSGAGITADPDDPVQGAAMLADLVSSRFQPKVNVEFVNGYHRRSSARDLVQTIHELCGAPTVGRVSTADGARARQAEMNATGGRP
jgi:glycosyltransferase involved in cell wall biosynthesis